MSNSKINQAILRVAKENPEFRRALAAELAQDKTAMRFKSQKAIQEWQAKTDPRVRKSIDGHLAKIKRLETSLASKTKVSSAKVKKAVKKLLAGDPEHPNKLAFDILFPKARGFSFADLDFNVGNPEVEALDPKDIKRYHLLAAGLGKIWDSYFAITKWRDKDSYYRNLPLWDEKPYSQFARRFATDKTALDNEWDNAAFHLKKQAAIKGSATIERGLHEAMSDADFEGSKRMRDRSRQRVLDLMTSMESTAEDFAQTKRKTKKLAEVLAHYAMMISASAKEGNPTDPRTAALISKMINTAERLGKRAREKDRKYNDFDYGNIEEYMEAVTKVTNKVYDTIPYDRSIFSRISDAARFLTRARDPNDSKGNILFHADEALRQIVKIWEDYLRTQ